MYFIIHIKTFTIISDNGTAPLPIRLIGSSVLQGRIEILYYGIWGTICDTNFDLDSANVACRRLGFPGAARVLRYIAGGSGQIWLNNVRCVGNETGLERCLHYGFGDIAWYCDHNDDAGVECLRKFLLLKQLIIHYEYVLHTYIHTYIRK